MNSRKFLWPLVMLVALITGLVGYRSLYSASYSDLIQVYQQPRLLNEFQLQSYPERTVTKADVMGQWTLVFLGYLSCPDICPMTMAKLSNVLPKLQDTTEKPVQVFFVSVDPKRDQLPTIAEYARYFNSTIVGLRAEHTALYPFVRNLGLMYSVPEPDAENYFVDHSASIAVISPEGNLVAMVKPKFTLGSVPVIDSEQMISDLSQLFDN